MHNLGICAKIQSTLIFTTEDIHLVYPKFNSELNKTRYKMHALRPRLNTLSSHTMTMLMVIVAVGSSVSYVQLYSQRPEVDVGVSKIHFLYVFHFYSY